MQNAHNPGESALRDLPMTAWTLVGGVALFGFGFVLESIGYPVEAGITGALALFFVAIAVFGQLLVWVLGHLD